jgi:alpha-tubulin suppressor-like RCC1 family protein
VKKKLPVVEPTLLQITNKIPGNVAFVVKIRHVAASCDHVLVCTTDGKCYGWGSNRYGKLGIDVLAETISEPTLNKRIMDHQIAMCAVGQDHSLFLTKIGLVLSAGLNEFGQLGIQ